MSGNEPQSPHLVDPRPLLQASALHLLAWLGVAAAVFVMVPGPGSLVAAKSLVIGALIAILPAAIMARAVFRFRKTIAPRDYTRAIYRGELGKFLLTVVLFALALVEGGALQVPVLFATFLVALVVQWVLAARHLLRQ